MEKEGATVGDEFVVSETKVKQTKNKLEISVTLTPLTETDKLIRSLADIAAELLKRTMGNKPTSNKPPEE